MNHPHNDPHQKYLKTRIETASQPQLLLMLFEGAVKKLHIAKRAIGAKDIEKAHTELTKVQKIFTELMMALDFEKGGDLATELMRIYDFIYHHLVKANIKQDVVMIDEVLPVVENLKDGWTQAVEKYNAEQSTGTEGKPAPIPQQAAPKQPLPKPAAIPRGYPTSQPAAANDESAPRPRINLQG